MSFSKRRKDEMSFSERRKETENEAHAATVISSIAVYIISFNLISDAIGSFIRFNKILLSLLLQNLYYCLPLCLSLSSLEALIAAANHITSDGSSFLYCCDRFFIFDRERSQLLSGASHCQVSPS